MKLLSKNATVFALIFFAIQAYPFILFLSQTFMTTDFPASITLSHLYGFAVAIQAF